MQYFFDVSLLDVRGEINSALTLLYYGNEVGAFGDTRYKPLDLTLTDCIEIDLTAYAANNDGLHNYAIMFFERQWNEQVWKLKLFEKKRDLRSITTKVQLSSKITEHPPHEHHLFTSSNRYIDFAEYSELAASQVVPPEYVMYFNQRFVGYLMRSERDFEDVHAMFNCCGLQDNFEQALDQTSKHEQVRMAAYSKAS